MIYVFFDWNTISCLDVSNCLLSINRHFGSISSLSCAEEVYVLFREIRFMKDAFLTCTLNTQRRSLTPKLLQLTEIQGTLPSRELFLVHRLKKANLCSEGMELMVNVRYLYVALSPKSYICVNRVNACNVQHELVNFLAYLRLHKRDCSPVTSDVCDRLDQPKLSRKAGFG
jgi:hypothetical protein